MQSNDLDQTSSGEIRLNAGKKRQKSPYNLFVVRAKDLEGVKNSPVQVRGAEIKRCHAANPGGLHRAYCALADRNNLRLSFVTI